MTTVVAFIGAVSDEGGGGRGWLGCVETGGGEVLGLALASWGLTVADFLVGLGDVAW